MLYWPIQRYSGRKDSQDGTYAKCDQSIWWLHFYWKINVKNHRTIKTSQNTPLSFKLSYSIALAPFWSSPESSLLWISLVMQQLSWSLHLLKNLLFMVILILGKCLKFPGARFCDYGSSIEWSHIVMSLFHRNCPKHWSVRGDHKI